MKDVITIELKGLCFFAFHGVYEEEKKIGNEFTIDLLVSYSPGDGIVTGLEKTINYAALHDLLKKEMKQPRELLETFAMEMTEKIQAAFPMSRRIDICITKLHPPIAQCTGTVGVRYIKEY